MRGHGRPRRSGQVAVFTLVVVWLLACLDTPTHATDSLATENLPVAWQDDAELTDIHFINVTTGWAVGAQGVILRTTDGGKNWLQHGQVTPEAIASVPLSEKLSHMRSGTKTRWTGIANANGQGDREVRCRLESVHFIDPQRGWVAGGYTVPWLDRSRGVILQTVDGGVTWDRVSRLTLPAVTKIHFQNRRVGWAIGEANQLHPSGIYYTNDGGRNWSSTATSDSQRWRGGERTTGGFALIDDAGRLASVVEDQRTPPGLFGCTRDDPVADLAMVDGEVGYAAGPNGLLLKTDNGGVAWRRVKLAASEGLESLDARSLDFSRVAIRDGFAWLSLRGGGRLAKLNLADQSLEWIDLPTTPPLRKLVFASDTHGYAVADFGTILATVDGGLTWQRQRGTHDRVAMLFVANRPQDISVSLLAIHAGERNRICGTVLVADPKVKAARAQYAFERVGSCVNWQVASAEGSAVALTEVIRTLRPLVVVCCGIPYASDQGQQAHLLATATREAIENAATQGIGGQLPWQVERLVTAGVGGSIRISAAKMLPSLGKSAGDAAAVSRAMLGQSFREVGPSTWTASHPVTVRPMSRGDFLSGLGNLGIPIPKRLQETSIGNLNLMHQTMAMQRRLRKLVKADVSTDQARLAWRQEVQANAMPMEADIAGLWLMRLAEQSLAAGHTAQAADALQLLATRWPGNAWAAAASAWLGVYYASAEAAVLERKPDCPSLTAATMGERLQHAALHMGQLGRSDPAIALEPAVQWLESRLLARSSPQMPIAPRLKQLASLRQEPAQAFAAAARAELGHLEGGSHRATTEKSSGQGEELTCVFTSKRPRLDGVLDDAVWNQVRCEGAVTQCRASDADSEPSDEACFARDDEFFYAAYRCSKKSGQSYRYRPGKRPRDPDLSRRDRVELRIDTDRDFASAVTLVVDHRGWAADSAFGNDGWNPQWYVAQAEDADAWTIEFAIPLKAFVAIDAGESDRWAIRLDRFGSRGKPLWQRRANALGDGRPDQVVTGLRAGLLPDPRGFQIMRVAGAAVAAPAIDDPHVEQAQFQLDLPAEPTGLPAARVPMIPELGELP